MYIFPFFQDNMNEYWRAKYVKQFCGGDAQVPVDWYSLYVCSTKKIYRFLLLCENAFLCVQPDTQKNGIVGFACLYQRVCLCVRACCVGVCKYARTCL